MIPKKSDRNTLFFGPWTRKMRRTILLLLALALADGTASQKTKKLTCGFPGSPAHGHVRPDKDAYSEGDLVFFGCRVGHILLGSRISRCTEDGSWSEGIPICDDSMTTLGEATATPTLPGHAAEFAIDRDKESCTYLKPRKPRWWRTELGGKHKVLSVAVTMTTMDKYAKFSVFVLTTKKNIISYKRCASFDGKFDKPTMVFPCEGGGIEGQRVQIEDHIQTEGLFEICEVEVQVEKDTGYDCGKPNRHLHSVTFEPQNDIVQYGCIKGYELNGSEFRHCLNSGQWSEEAPDCILQMQDHDIPSFAQLTDDTAPQLADLQKNISALWSYIYELRGAVTNHLNHLRQHQIEMEDTIHRLEHHRPSESSHGDSHASHTAGHSHSGENHAHGSSSQHSRSGEDHHHHSGEHHSHGGDDHSHAHSGEHHSHGGDDHSHAHSGEHHSHGGDDHGHSHSGEHQSHGHYHDSHSHTDGDHAHGDDHSHGHAHKDSHENADDLQQTAQVSEPLVEPVIVASTRRPSNYPKPHSHQHHHSSGSINLMGEDSHHFHHSNSRSRSKNVTMPKYSEYDLYEYAVCNVLPNKGLSVEQQQNIVGTVAFWQKKTGGPLNIHLRLTGFSMGGDHHAHHQQSQQQQEEDHVDHPTSPMQHRHGFHVHADADITNGCQGCGPHYNPKGVKHGGPKSLVRHVGDLGNIECDEHGIANLAFSDGIASLKGPYSIVGKSLVIHAGEDDLGLGGDDESLKTGNAGARLACCVIEKIDKLPFRSYKAMKTAIQYQN